MAKAIWGSATLAESNETKSVEGNAYFPPESLNLEYFRPSQHTTVCSWKGKASYYDVVVNGLRIRSRKPLRSKATWPSGRVFASKTDSFPNASKTGAAKPASRFFEHSDGDADGLGTSVPSAAPQGALRPFPDVA